MSLLPENMSRRDLITSGITYFERGSELCSENLYGTDWCHIHDLSLAATDSSRHVKGLAQVPWSEPVLPPEYCLDGLGQPSLSRTIGHKYRQTVNGHFKSHHELLFPEGDYLYNFEYLVHGSLPATFRTELMSTRYYLEAMVEPAGPFRSKVISQTDIPLVRLPSENSLELIDPVLFSKRLPEQLQYDACIFGRSFCFGSRIPMMVRLTPLVNTELCWIKVYVSQHVQYWTVGHEPRPLQLPAKKVLLFKKELGSAEYSTYPGSEMRISPCQGSLKTPSSHAVGEGLQAVEIELEVQLPRCSDMRLNGQRSLLQLSTQGSGPVVVKHWIQVRVPETALCCKDTHVQPIKSWGYMLDHC